MVTNLWYPPKVRDFFRTGVYVAPPGSLLPFLVIVYLARTLRDFRQFFAHQSVIHVQKTKVCLK